MGKDGVRQRLPSLPMTPVLTGPTFECDPVS